MKKLISTIAIIVIAILATTTFTYATVKNNVVVTVLSNIGNINKLEVRGNVEVILSNGTKDEVAVASNYYAENALIQNNNGVLRISSYKAEKTVVYVTVNDLRSIAAYDNAVVKSDGRLSIISLDVNLFNNAYAGLKLDNYTANIVVNDQAKADLSGNIVEYSLVYSVGSTVNRTELAAINTSEVKTQPNAMQAAKAKHADAEETVGL